MGDWMAAEIHNRLQRGHRGTMLPRGIDTSAGW
jgi:hypothetical protein